MNKLELVEALREERGQNKSEATVVVDVFFDETGILIQIIPSCWAKKA